MNHTNAKPFCGRDRLPQQRPGLRGPTSRRYFRELDAARILTAREERELASRISAGDADARDRLIQANLGLVVYMAGAFAAHQVETDDLIEEGILGLI